jgi:hypothetical protein
LADLFQKEASHAQSVAEYFRLDPNFDWNKWVLEKLNTHTAGYSWPIG